MTHTNHPYIGNSFLGGEPVSVVLTCSASFVSSSSIWSAWLNNFSLSMDRSNMPFRTFITWTAALGSGLGPGVSPSMLTAEMPLRKHSVIMLPEIPDIVPTWKISVLSFIFSSHSAFVAPPKTRLSPVVVAIPAIETMVFAFIFCIQSIRTLLISYDAVGWIGTVSYTHLTL